MNIKSRLFCIMLILSFLFSALACQNENLTQKKTDQYEASSKTNLIKIDSNYFFFVKEKNEKSSLYEYRPNSKTAVKTDLTFYFDYRGHAYLDERLVFFGANQVSIYKTNASAISDRVKFLPTPRSDNILLGLNQADKVLCLTTDKNEIIAYTLVGEEWVATNSINLEQQFTPKQNLEAIQIDDVLYLFWYASDNVCYVNTETKEFKNILNPIGKLNNPYFWKQNNHVYFADFDKDNFDQPTFFLLDNLTSKPAIIKNNAPYLPPFKSPIKSKGFSPFFTNDPNNPDAYYYGNINGHPVLISDLNETLPVKPTEQIGNDINQSVLTLMGVLIGSVFIFSMLFRKISIAWENKVKTNLLPQNAIFFGPTIHRGLAVFLDLQIIFFCLLLVILFLPIEIKFDFLSSLDRKNIDLPKGDFRVYIIFYFVQIIYFSLMEYYKGYTFGKHVLGLEVRSDITLRRITFAQAFSRNLLPKHVDILIIASNLMITFSRRKKSLHDHVGNTVVLYKRLNDKLDLKLDFSPSNDYDKNN